MEHLYLFLILALVCEILGTIGGFGSSLFFIPIASYFLDFHSVLGITALFHVSSNLAKIFFFREGFNKQVILYLGIPAVIFVVLGAYFSKYVNSQLAEFFLAIFLIILSAILLIYSEIKIYPTKQNSISGGVLSGFIAGLLGTGGAIRGMVLAAFNLKTEVFIATSAIIDLGIDASRSVVYFLNGFVHYDDLYLIPLLLIVSILGTYIGKLILKRVSQDQFKNIVLVLILITGISSVIKTVRELWF